MDEMNGEEIKILRLQNNALRRLNGRIRENYYLVFFITVFFVVGIALIHNYTVDQMSKDIIELQKHKFAILSESILMDKQKYVHYCGCELNHNVVN